MNNLAQKNLLNSEFLSNLEERHRRGLLWYVLFHIATAIAIVMLVALVATIVNQSFGLVAIENKISPYSLTRNGVNLDEMTKEKLVEVLSENISKGLRRRLEFERPFSDRSKEEIFELIIERVVDPSVVQAWTLFDSVFSRKDILIFVAGEFPNAEVKFRSWINKSFIVQAQSSIPEDTGVRAAIKGSLWTIFFAMLFAFPIGVGASIYLEEYAGNTRFNRIIQTNINNLAGNPSIIYGMLGLTVFVRSLAGFTSGAFLGLSQEVSQNGRTVLSAGLTLGLLILPLIIINAQEAIRSVPVSLRQSSYGLGATKWQTIWYHVLPQSFDRVLTGTILAMSRAIGETASMVVVGASTFVTLDPAGPFSKFTTLTIQIYQWTARPQVEFRNAAGAAILVLLILLLSLNATAIFLRNYYARKRR